MILPTKHLPPGKSLIGLGAKLLVALETPQTVSALWARVRHVQEIATFERFVLTLDLLYAMGAVDIADGLLRRSQR